MEKFLLAEHNWTRRETLVGGALTIFFGITPSCCSAQGGSKAPHSRGCLLADEDFETVYPVGTDTSRFVFGNEPIIFKSGDNDFDLALAQMLATMSSKFGVLPGFAYYDDSDGQNAYATKRVRLNNIDGTVLFGISFYKSLRRLREAPEVAIATVCAHEFGHILQFKFGLLGKLNTGQPTVKRSELQADYFAGFFAGIRKRERPTYPAAVAVMTQRSFGDTNFGSPNHHGTPDERGAATAKGFEASFRDNKTLAEAIEESARYVMAL